MESRMDKYNTNTSSGSSRTQKNRALYDEVRNSVLTDFDVNSNVSVIGDSDGNIDFGEVRRLIDSDTPRRKSIQIPKFEETRESFDEPILDTKEYDINAILEKAKEGKEIDYTKERTRKVREAQYKILSDLDLGIQKAHEGSYSPQEEETNLMNLINTITEIELKNKQEYNKEASEALDLLSDLSDSDGEKTEPEKEENDHITDTEAFTTEIKEEIKKEVMNEVKEEVKDEVQEELKQKEHESHTAKIEKTLHEINVNLDKYNDFMDIQKSDKSSIIMKFFLFILVVALILGAVYITDMLLDLGLVESIFGG